MTLKVKTILYRLIAIALIIVSMLSAYSCNHSNSSSSNATDSISTSPATLITHKIDTLHEQVMDKIGPLRKLEDSIRGRIKMVAHHSKDTSGLSHLANALNASDTAMFGWMGQYNTHLKGKSDSEKVIYLQYQFQELDHLNATMDSIINAARDELQ